MRIGIFQVWRITTEQRRAAVPLLQDSQFPPVSPEPPASRQRAEARQEAGAGLTSENNYTKLTVYNLLDEEVQENEKIYDQAAEDYEAAKKKAESSLAQAQSNLKLLNTQLEEAQIAYDKQQVSSQSDYDAAAAESSSAQEVYEAELSRIEEETNVAFNEKEEARENLQEFEDTIGDGCLYTQSAGTVMMVGVRAESAISGNSMVLAYSNPETVTVTASVDQSDIASVSIGESVTVEISDHGTFRGNRKQDQSGISVQQQIQYLLFRYHRAGRRYQRTVPESVGCRIFRNPGVGRGGCK